MNETTTQPIKKLQELAMKLAIWHVEECGGVPDRRAWLTHWDHFCAKYEATFNLLDFQVVEAYAMAALRYDSRVKNSYSQQQDSEGKWQWVEHTGHTGRSYALGGLWDRRGPWQPGTRWPRIRVLPSVEEPKPELVLA